MNNIIIFNLRILVINISTYFIFHASNNIPTATITLWITYVKTKSNLIKYY